MATHNIKYRSGFKFAYINGYEDLPEDARKTLIDLTLKDWPASAIVYRLATIHHLEFSKSAIEHEMHRIRKGYGIKPGDMVGREARR